MISTQLQLPKRVYHLANQYELGEPIRVYQVTPMKWRTLAFMILGFSSLLVGIGLTQSGFHVKPTDLILYGIFLGIATLVPLFFFIHSKQTENAAVYICSTGFIARNKKRLRAVRWKEISEVTSNLAYTSCTVQLVDQTSIKPNIHIKRFRFLIAELELKAQLSAHPELALEIEQQFEQIQNDPPWLRQAQAKANLYQEMAYYLKQKDPEEAYQFGEDYQLGTVLGTYHATFQSVFLPNADTAGEAIFACIMTIMGISSLLSGGFSWKSVGSLILVLSGLLVSISWLRTAWNTRLYFFEEGLIYIQPGAFSIIKWEQITKTVCSQPAMIFGPLCTLQLDDNGRIYVNKYLNKRNDIKQILRERTTFIENPLSKKAR